MSTMDGNNGNNGNDIMWDAYDGIGQVPYNIEVARGSKGFVKMMYPQEFRDLCLPGVSDEETAPYAIEAVKEGLTFGQPMLYLKWLENKQKWIVTGHEGRSRSVAFETLFPDQQMTVHIVPHTNSLRQKWKKHPSCQNDSLQVYRKKNTKKNKNEKKNYQN